MNSWAHLYQDLLTVHTIFYFFCNVDNTWSNMYYLKLMSFDEQFIS